MPDREQAERIARDFASFRPGSIQRALGIAYLDLAAQLAERERENVRMREAILWACGEGDSDFYSEGERERAGLPIYWWRKRLHASLSDSEERG